MGPWMARCRWYLIASGPALETVSSLRRGIKHLFECVAADLSARIEYSLEKAADRMYVRNTVSYPALPAERRVRATRTRLTPTIEQEGPQMSTAVLDRRSSAMSPSTVSTAAASFTASSPAPGAPHLRLTARGRAVVTGLVVLPLAVVIAFFSWGRGGDRPRRRPARRGVRHHPPQWPGELRRPAGPASRRSGDVRRLSGSGPPSGTQVTPWPLCRRGSCARRSRLNG